MSASVVLQWNFSPAGYFEEMADFVCQSYMMKIVNGKVETKIDSLTYGANPSLKEILHNCLNNQFLI
jgi:hypothetical protein